MDTVKKLLLLFLFSFTPLFAFASVKINEIAWMGSNNGGTANANSSDEWIELYNDGTDVVDFSGWKMEWGGGNVEVEFGKDLCKGTTIQPNGYFLMERTDDNSAPNILADCIYTGAMFNDGEFLELKDTYGNPVISVDGTKKEKEWQINSAEETVGNNTTKETAQRTDAGWITATATPKALNAGVLEAAEQTLAESETSSQEITSGGSISTHSSSAEATKITAKKKLALSAGRDRVMLVGAPIRFAVNLADKDGVLYQVDNPVWSFGDGQFSQERAVSHIYEYAGEYVVVLNGYYEGEEYVSRANVKILKPNFSVASKDGGIEIGNNLTTETNLKDWIIKSGQSLFTFTADTIILPNKKITFSPKITKIFGKGDSIELFSPEGKSVAMWKPVEVISTIETGNGPKNLENNNAGYLAELAKAENTLKILQDSLMAQVAPPIVHTEKPSRSSIVKPAEFATTTDKVIKIGGGKKWSIWSFLKSLF